MTDCEFEHYFDLNFKRVYTAAMCYLKKRQDAEDVTQDVFLKLYTYSGDFIDDEHAKSWLLRCAINECKDILRSYRFKFLLPLDSVGDIEYKEQSRDDQLLHIMHALNNNNRLVLYLYYYEDYSCAEISRIVGISEDAVSARLRRGRKQLKKLIEKEGR